MRAAQTLVAAGVPGRHGLLPKAQEAEVTQRALRLLQGRLDGDRAANELELDVLTQMVGAYGSGSQSARLLAIERMQALQQRHRAARGPQADHTHLEEAGKAFISRFYMGVMNKLGISGLGAADDAQRPPTAEEFAEAAATLVAITRARAGGGSGERRFFCLPCNAASAPCATRALVLFLCYVGVCRRSTGCR